MYWTFLFDIMNNQEDYARCQQVIDFVQKGKKGISCDGEFWGKVKYVVSDREAVWGNIASYQTVDGESDLLLVKKEDEVKYVFQVDCSDENDMVNLIYYCLLNEELENKSILCIKARHNWKLIANVKDLLSDLVVSQKIRDCYFFDGSDYHKINILGERNIKRFSPIYYIGEEEESVAYWRQSVHTFLLKMYRESPIASSEYEYSTNYFLPHICPKPLRELYKEEIVFPNYRGKNYKLINIFAECFCTCEHRNKINFVRNRYQMWKSKEFFELVKDMPLLAMYIFCISDYFSRNEENDTIESIRSEIFNARDMADGLLQIIENIYHSEKKRGFFCFRVHSNSKGRSRKYLEEHYRQYMSERNPAEEENRDYLEVKVVDFSHQTIPEQFFANFVKRMNHANDRDKVVYEKIKDQAQNIKVTSFFDAMPFWQEYNSISENVVHHYGLQVFDSFVSCYDGYFRVRSQKDYSLQSEDDVYCSVPGRNEDAFGKIGIPGTQYDIIIPFKKQKIMQNIALNVNICYTDYLVDQYETCRTIDFTTDTCWEVYTEVQNNFPEMSYQEKKEKTIHELENRLCQDLSGKITDNTIIHFPAEKISPTMIEMFCKSLMLYIARKPREASCYIMITDCLQSHFVEITRMLALFYDKQGVNSLMVNTQIFLSGQKEGEEFLIVGENLGEVVGSTEKLAFSRCVNPDCLKIMKNMLKNRKIGKIPNETVSIVPFDMVVYDDNKPTLFERDLKWVLGTEVQSEAFGCKLENLHVRIGSKIHIRTFYEAELLFHNNYYTSRFAYWMREEIRKNQNLDLKKQITLVGYENYSEMLLNELRNMLDAIGVETEYIIYEQKATEKFRAGRPLDEYKDSQFIIIIPINSTMTTHIKVVGFLQKTIKEELKRKEDKEYVDYSLRRVAYYGIVLIADVKENDYWVRIENKKNKVISKIDNNEMTYYVEVNAEWAHPLKCADCFPTEDYTKELPLIETNKESVIPMQAIGIKRTANRQIDRTISPEEKIRMQELSQLLIFDHVERNGNHFNYYFCTEKLWDIPNIQQNVREWLKQKRELFPPEERKVYDIIVAPLHFSNTAFVEEVNHTLFGNAALVLHFDVDKEFRMNVKAKYSSLQQLYDNLCEDDEESVINFHYVDDTIVSGRTYHRTKSLISSLITRKGKDRITINLFKSVVLILNRLSLSSIKGYIEDSAYFLAYFNLNISSMRVNADACVLCKKQNEWNKLADQASLNEVYLYWKNKSKKVECKPIEKLQRDKNAVNPEKQRRAALYMMASHRAKSLLNQLCDCYQKDEIQKEIVDTLFPDLNGSLDELIAVLKVLGRPFLTFRREIKETVFQLMLTMLDGLLQDSPPKGDDKLQNILCTLWEKPDDRRQMISMLINRLAELESNYIIRKNSMNRILQYAVSQIQNTAGSEQFIDNYLNRIKQLVGQSNDFAKGLYLEYLLLYDEEYEDGFETKNMVSLFGGAPDITFKRKAYLENTKLFNYGIEALEGCFDEKAECSPDKMMKALNETYYLDNFIQYLAFHKMVNVDKNGKITDFTSPEAAEKLMGMVRFQMLYQEVFGEKEKTEQDLKDKFREMLNYLKMASGALDAEIIVPYKVPAKGVEKYIALELGEGKEIRALKNSEKNLHDFMKNNSQFEGDTFAICEQEEKVWILIKVYDAAGTGDNIPVIYLLFPFEKKDKGELLHTLKHILVFREKIMRMLKLSSSTLLQNWTDNLFYKQQMLKSRAVGHSELETLSKQIEELSDRICGDEENPLFREYFELLVNSMIGFMNSQVLGGKGKDYMTASSCRLREFWEGDGKVFEAATKMWNLDIDLRDEDNLLARKIRAGTELQDRIPELTVMRILFLTILQNAQKHGLHRSMGKIHIEMYEENGELCISNEVDETEKDMINKEISIEAYRSGEGISQAVIRDLCESWYLDDDYEKIFTLQYENNSQKWNYVVKLPILERKGEE